MHNNDDTGEKMDQAFLKSVGIFLTSFLPNAILWIWICGRSELDLLLMLWIITPTALVYLLVHQATDQHLSNTKNTHYYTNNLQRYAFVETIRKNAWNLQMWLVFSIVGLMYVIPPKETPLWISIPIFWLIHIGGIWADYKMKLVWATERRREWDTRND